MPAPETCDAIRNAATTAGRLASLRNWSTESMIFVPQSESQFTRCAVCWSLVRTRSVTAAPDIVSSARIEITANVLIG